MEDKKGQADKSKNSQEKEPINLEDFESPEYNEIKKQYDPLRVFLHERGFDPEEPHFTYRTVEKLKKEDPKNADKVTGCQPISFDNYHDLLKFRQTLSDEEKREFDSFTWDDDKKKWKGIAVLADNIFWKNIYDSNHELYKFRNDFSVLMEGVKEERLKDEYLEAVKRGEVRNFKEDVAQIFKQREDLILSFGEVSDFNEIFKKVRELEALEKDLEQNRDYINHSGNEEWWDILWESALKFEDSEPLERFLKEIEWIRDKGPEYLDWLIADDPNVVKPYFSFEKYPFVGEAILRLAKSQKIEYKGKVENGEKRAEKVEVGSDHPRMRVNLMPERKERKSILDRFKRKDKEDKPKKENVEEMQKIAQETVGAEVFAQERGTYVKFYDEYKNHYGRKELNKFKEIVFPLRDLIEKGEKNKFVKELEARGVEGLRADLIYDMAAAKLAYDNKKKAYIDDAVLNKRTELENEKRVEGDELEEELKKFRAEKLFGIVTDEMRRVELEKAEAYPPKEKNIFFKLLDGYSKFSREHRMARLAIMSVLMTGGFAVFGGGVVGAGLLKTVGLRFGRGLLSMGLSQGVGKFLDKKLEVEDGEKKLKVSAEDSDLASFEHEFQENLNRIKIAERLKLGIKFFAMTATGLGVSAGIGMLEHSLLGGGVEKVDEVPSKKETAPVGQKPESAPAEPSAKQPIEKPSEQPEVKESEAPAEPAKTLSPKEKIPFAPKKLVETLGIEKEAIDQRADVEIPDQQADAKIPDQKADIEIPDQIADGKVFDQRADGGLTDQKADAVAIDQEAGGIVPDQQADKVTSDQKADGLAFQENNSEAIDQKADGGKTSALSEDQFADKEVLDQKAGETVPSQQADEYAHSDKDVENFHSNSEDVSDQQVNKIVEGEKNEKDIELAKLRPEKIVDTGNGVKASFKYAVDGKIEKVTISGGEHFTETGRVLKDDFRYKIFEKSKSIGLANFAGEKVENMAMDVLRRKELLETLWEIGRGDSLEAEYLRNSIKQAVEETERNFGDVFKDNLAESPHGFNLEHTPDQSFDTAHEIDIDSESSFKASDLTAENEVQDAEIYKEGVKPWLEKTTGITNIEKTGWLNENYLKTHTVRDVLNSDFVNKNFRIDQPYIRGTKEWIEWHDKLAFNEQVEKVLREQVPFWERWGTAKDMKLEEFLIKYGKISGGNRN